jgi:hypothetical protein
MVDGGGGGEVYIGEWEMFGEVMWGNYAVIFYTVAIPV